MQNAPAFIALAAVTVGAMLLLQGQQGSGAGQITTDDTSEGSIMDLAGLAGQIADAATPAPQDNPNALSAAGMAALQMREGFSATPYADHKGYSIGFGHLIKPGENLATVTVGQAVDLMRTDIAWAVQAVADTITAPINQSQFDALVSFAYNVGEGAFKRSTLARRINAGDPGASDEFGRWIYASGQQNSALIARRTSEKNQFESGTA
jgi:GH24 family phage-related lysozyme (muramidase)